MHGIVVGKFNPPHRGHHFLIDTAEKASDRVSVIICTKKDEEIPGSLRASWLQQRHPHITTYLLPTDQLPADQPTAWAQAILHLLPTPPDTLFSSEAYGEGYAPLLTCQHVMVDPLRQSVPVSSTLIRQNPSKYREFLEPPVCTYFNQPRPLLPDDAASE